MYTAGCERGGCPGRGHRCRPAGSGQPRTAAAVETVRAGHRERVGAAHLQRHGDVARQPGQGQMRVALVVVDGAVQQAVGAQLLEAGHLVVEPSSSSTCGSVTMARAIATRCRSPPESCTGSFATGSVVFMDHYKRRNRSRSSLACGHAISTRLELRFAKRSNDTFPFSYGFEHRAVAARSALRTVSLRRHPR